jgi:hypothetical protein
MWKKGKRDNFLYFPYDLARIHCSHDNMRFNKFHSNGSFCAKSQSFFISLLLCLLFSYFFISCQMLYCRGIDFCQSSYCVYILFWTTKVLHRFAFLHPQSSLPSSTEEVPWWQTAYLELNDRHTANGSHLVGSVTLYSKFTAIRACAARSASLMNLIFLFFRFPVLCFVLKTTKMLNRENYTKIHKKDRLLQP